MTLAVFNNFIIIISLVEKHSNVAIYSDLTQPPRLDDTIHRCVFTNSNERRLRENTPLVGRVHESHVKSGREGRWGGTEGCWLGQGGRNASDRVDMDRADFSPFFVPPRQIQIWQLCCRPFFSPRERVAFTYGKSEGLIGRSRGNHVHTSADATRLAGADSADDETTATATRSAGVPTTRLAIGHAEYWAFIRRVRDTKSPFSKSPTEMTSGDEQIPAERWRRAWALVSYFH